MMEQRPIDSIKVQTRYRVDLGDVDLLAQSIAAVNLLHPIVIQSDGTLIAGERRLEACKRLGWVEIPVRVVDPVDVLRAEHDENVVRKDFLPSEAVAIARAMEPEEKAAALERQQEGRIKGGIVRHEEPCLEESCLVESFHQAEPGSSPAKTRDKIAAYAGMSGRTLDKAKAIVEAAETEPEKHADLFAEMDRTGRVDGVHRKLKKRQQAEQLQAEPAPLPTGPFRVIVADPPWRYDSRNEDPSHRANLPYPPMTIDEIKDLPVGELAHNDCVLWLWTTNAHIRQAFNVAESWGFECKTILTWIKNKMGTGEWLRGQTEHCLLCVRGRPTVSGEGSSTVLSGKVREHSRKPVEFYELVEAICPGSKVELFAREQRPGWYGWGDQTTLFNKEGEV